MVPTWVNALFSPDANLFIPAVAANATRSSINRYSTNFLTSLVFMWGTKRSTHTLTISLSIKIRYDSIVVPRVAFSVSQSLRI
jgi:hypothetical protein